MRAWVEVNPQPPTADGPLGGLAFGAKDIFGPAPLPPPTALRSTPARGTGDAALVALLRGRGAVLLGKTHTTAFASSTPRLRAIRARPAARPAAVRGFGGGGGGGHGAFAIGTQTLGSILRPAAYCGVCGFKPTFGLLPIEGALPFAPSLDTAGFFTATAAGMRELWPFVGQAVPPANPEPLGRHLPGAPRMAGADRAALLVNRFEGARSHGAL